MTNAIKLRADLILVHQQNLIEQAEKNIDNCIGCVFYTTQSPDNRSNLCKRVNSDTIRCKDDLIWVIDEGQWNSFKFKEEK